MAFGLIYLIIDGTNDKEYVGQTTRTVEERFTEHMRCKYSNIGRAIRKRGAENFATVILKECDSQEELNYWEKHFIKSRGTRWPLGFNNSDGGEGGWERTPESIAKMSRKGKKHSDETKIELSLKKAGKPGRPLTDEEKAHLSEVAPNKRKVICIETGKIFDSVSAAARFHNVTVQSLYESCKNPSRIVADFHWKFVVSPDESSEIEKAPMKSRKKRRVVCVDTGEEFESIREAARYYSVDRKSIAEACNNPEKISAGHHWRFAETEFAEMKVALVKKNVGKSTKPRRVMCIETGKVFDSLSEAERLHKIPRSSIAKVCKKIMLTAGGFHWKFVDDDDEIANDNTGREVRHLSDEHKAILSAKTMTKKPVICVESGVVYESVNEAERVLVVRNRSIRRACKETSRTAGGYHWRFV